MIVDLPASKFVTTCFFVLDEETKIVHIYDDGCNLVAKDMAGKPIAFYAVNPPLHVVSKLIAFERALHLLFVESATYAKSWYPCFYAV